MNFSAALIGIKAHKRMQRAGWNGKNQWVRLKDPDADSDMHLPYIYICTVKGDLVPWLASQTDLLAEDWVEVT